MTRNYGILYSAGNSWFSFDLHGYANNRFISLHAFVDNAAWFVFLEGSMEPVKESLHDNIMSVILFFEPSILMNNYLFLVYSEHIV